MNRDRVGRRVEQRLQIAVEAGSLALDDAELLAQIIGFVQPRALALEQRNPRLEHFARRRQLHPVSSPGRHCDLQLARTFVD
jgi:hypothetical protein